MPRKIERSIEELYEADPERAEAAVFGRKVGCESPGLPGRQRAGRHERRRRRDDPVRREHARRVDPSGARTGETGAKQRTAVSEIPRQA